MNWRAYVDQPALREFVAVEEEGWRILARRQYERWAMGLLTANRDAGAGAATRTVGGGRADHPVVELPDGSSAVVREYRRGGMMRHINRDRYFVGHRPFAEMLATERAREAGVRAPEVLVAAEWRRRPGYGAVLATRLSEGAIGLDRWLQQPTAPGAPEALQAAGEQIGRMHAAGIAHADLNLRNLLVSPAQDRDVVVYLIDFDRARLSARPVDAGRRARDLKRFARSATKLGVVLGEPAWVALRAGYGADWPKSFFSP